MSENPASPRRAPTARLGDFERPQASDVADAVGYAVTRARHIAVGEPPVRPAERVA
ncbi:hypothetical protein [Streptomyces sp. NPDC054849]